MKLAGQDGGPGTCPARGPGSGGLVQSSEKVSPLQECGASRHGDVHLTVISGQFRQQVRLERRPQQPTCCAWGGEEEVMKRTGTEPIRCKDQGEGQACEQLSPASGNFWGSGALAPGSHSLHPEDGARREHTTAGLRPQDGWRDSRAGSQWPLPSGVHPSFPLWLAAANRCPAPC